MAFSNRDNPFDDPREASEPEEVFTEAAPAVISEASAQGAMRAKLADLEHQGRSGAGWFYWVAALSLVNSGIQLAGGKTQFVVGLGTMQVIDTFAAMIIQDSPDAVVVVRAIEIGFDVGIAAVVALFGWLACRRYTAVFVIGMALYLLDGMLFVIFQDWYSAAFHGLALYYMWNGLSAFRQLKALEADAPWADEEALVPATD